MNALVIAKLKDIAPHTAPNPIIKAQVDRVIHALDNDDDVNAALGMLNVDRELEYDHKLSRATRVALMSIQDLMHR